jgi:hypothetical protein
MPKYCGDQAELEYKHVIKGQPGALKLSVNYYRVIDSDQKPHPEILPAQLPDALPYDFFLQN